MKIRVFGVLTQVMPDQDWPLQQPQTVEAFLRHLREKHPRLKEYTFRVAVNQKLAAGDDMLRPGDELALLPPFAGG